ncbi:hypothetical protein Q9966_009630 [Columba livia]|nr:hypothetical protein Q9966_009630 [Columba livia]
MHSLALAACVLGPAKPLQHRHSASLHRRPAHPCCGAQQRPELGQAVNHLQQTAPSTRRAANTLLCTR